MSISAPSIKSPGNRQLVRFRVRARGQNNSLLVGSLTLFPSSSPSLLPPTHTSSFCLFDIRLVPLRLLVLSYCCLATSIFPPPSCICYLPVALYSTRQLDKLLGKTRVNSCSYFVGLPSTPLYLVPAVQYHRSAFLATASLHAPSHPEGD